ncbi:MAG: cytochrome c family protein [Deltaproteobacteria bacterium]|nr:cytochrome c family protein [Deltaproteobacteria bacterium]
MKRYYLILLIPIIILFALQVYAQQVPPVELLEVRDYRFEEFGIYKYPPAWFSHELHVEEYQVACSSCHHIYKDSKNIWTPENDIQKCSDCHGKSKQELTIAYHMKCWGCHKRAKEIHPIADVPTMECNRCHIDKANLAKEEKSIQQKLRHKERKVEEVIKNLKVKGFYK